jgi:NADPH-dependent ferric siderophore reductase
VPMSDAGWQLFAGDESALPGIAEMIEALPADVTATVLLEVKDAQDEQAVETAAGLDVRWLHRGDAAPGSGELLDRALEGVAVPPAGRHAFLFGESRTVRRLREIAMRRGLRPDEISAKGYWNLGRATRD